MGVRHGSDILSHGKNKNKAHKWRTPIRNLFLCRKPIYFEHWWWKLVLYLLSKKCARMHLNLTHWVRYKEFFKKVLLKDNIAHMSSKSVRNLIIWREPIYFQHWIKKSVLNLPSNKVWRRARKHQQTTTNWNFYSLSKKKFQGKQGMFNKNLKYLWRWSMFPSFRNTRDGQQTVVASKVGSMKEKQQLKELYQLPGRVVDGLLSS